MLHVSIKSIGWLVGGPEIIITALTEVLGPEGTVMMYVGWEDSPYTMAGWSDAKKEAYLSECPGFDPKTSRAVTAWGVVAEVLRTWPGTRRSHHPDGSFCALGMNAEYLTSDHSLRYGYGVGSPLARLVALKGKVLNIGAPLNTTTLLHHAEDRTDVPHKRRVGYRMPVKTADGGVEWVGVEEYDTSAGLVAWYEGDYFTDLMNEYVAQEQVQMKQVGTARSYLFDAADLHDFAVAWMESNLIEKHVE